MPSHGYLYLVTKPNAFAALHQTDQAVLIGLKTILNSNDNISVQYGRQNTQAGMEYYIEGISFNEVALLGDDPPSPYLVSMDTRRDDDCYAAMLTDLLDQILSLDRLSYLELYYFPMDVWPFVRVGGLTRLTYLGMPFAGRDEHLKYLKPLPDLQYLNLSDTNIHGPGLEYLTNYPHLQILDLSRMKLDPNYLSCLPRIPSLKKLIMTCSPIRDEDLKTITQIPQLEYLDLNSTEISDQCLGYLKSMARLKYVSVYNTRLSHEGIMRLKDETKDRMVINESPKNSDDQEIDRLFLLGALGNKEYQSKKANVFFKYINDNPLQYYKYMSIFWDVDPEKVERIRSALNPRQLDIIRQEMRTFKNISALLQTYLRYEPVTWEQQPLYQYIIENDKDVEQPIVFEEAAK